MTDAVPSQPLRGRPWLLRAFLALIGLIAIGVILFSNHYLTERFTDRVRDRSEVRLALYVNNLMSTLRLAAVVPQLLARDPELIAALQTQTYALSTARLMSFEEEIAAGELILLDRDGRLVAATNRSRLGETHRTTPYFVDAVRSNRTVFSTHTPGGAAFEHVYSRRIEADGQFLGVIAIRVATGALERSWAGVSDAVMVTDSEGTIVMATEPAWRGLTVEAALDRQSAPSAIARAFRTSRGPDAAQSEAYMAGEAVLRRDARVPHQGWRITSLTAYTSVRERVNSVLALEAMGFSILLALTFWWMSRSDASRVRLVQRESDELRALNHRLQQEIAEREKVEKTLKVAEQTIAQSSKLAALGEMSAAVSHELNQPLAAMKTYLAGARLLLQRRRPEEALSSFQRIDDLLERMGAITRQLKSYARKGADSFQPVDVRAAVSSALSMMEPQLKTRAVNIVRTLPDAPALILGDRLRLEQVIINLLRNALDATKSADDPTIRILLALGDTISLQVRDNGEGLSNLDELFEPFYTTKQPGDGVGLGLAISSGIVSDLGGRLTARNAPDGGAIFEVQLPRLQSDARAAE